MYRQLGSQLQTLSLPKQQSQAASRKEKLSQQLAEPAQPQYVIEIERRFARSLCKTY
jgi:hypothetical protein